MCVCMCVDGCEQNFSKKARLRRSQELSMSCFLYGVWGKGLQHNFEKEKNPGSIHDHQTSIKQEKSRRRFLKIANDNIKIPDKNPVFCMEDAESVSIIFLLSFFPVIILRQHFFSRCNRQTELQ